MRLKSLVLRNFRNYSDLELEFPHLMNLIVGDNAQGKTNLLEAIYFLSTARSHRTYLDDELIQHGADWFYLKGCLVSALTDTVVEISNVIGGRKRIKINGKTQPKISHLIGQTNVVLFSPESLALVKGSPTDRRKFLDILISQISPTYLQQLQTYQIVLKQRNELLKQIRDKRATSDLLAPWDEQLLEAGVNIIQKRAEIIAKLALFARERHEELTNSAEYLDINYKKSFECSNDGDLTSGYQNALCQSLYADTLRGSTSSGPHRDDLTISINNLDARRFGSQGQHRTAALSIKLAELGLIKDEIDELPIILLDDVASELDPNRATFLFNLLNQLNVQVFVTTTQLDSLCVRLSEGAILRVKSGTIAM